MIAGQDTAKYKGTGTVWFELEEFDAEPVELNAVRYDLVGMIDMWQWRSTIPSKVRAVYSAEELEDSACDG